MTVKRDISKEVSLEKKLQRAIKLEAIGTLAGGIAHDFNNYLTSIMGNVSLAKIYMESGSIAESHLLEAEEVMKDIEKL